MVVFKAFKRHESPDGSMCINLVGSLQYLMIFQAVMKILSLTAETQ